MKKINDYENIKVNDGQKFELGGKHCIIKNVKLFQYNGIEKISLELDVNDGDNKGYYQAKYDERPDTSKFWDDGATLSIHADADSISDEKERAKAKSYLKGIMTAIESYNTGYTWNWDEKSLIGKKISVNFSLKEYNGNDGNIYRKPQVSRFVNKKENFKENYIPQVRTINNQYIDYDKYIVSKNSESTTNNPFSETSLEDAVEITSDLLD
jgi:hypothetical protein